jgi:hypothetical protein
LKSGRTHFGELESCSNETEDDSMSGHTLPAVYESFEELFGRKSSIDELIAEISKYERSSMLWICAEIVCRVQLWARPGARNRANYSRYLQEFFEPSVSRRLVAGQSSVHPFRFLFHRRQIDLVAKLALQHCGSGLDAREHANELGVLFLMANDHLDYGLLRNVPVNADARERTIRLVTEMLAVQEGSSPAISNLFTRGHLMLTRYAAELATAHDFVDVVGEFERKVGLNLADFEALVFAVHSRFGAQMSNTVVTNSELLPLKREDFAQTALTPEKVEAFLKFVSIPPEELKNEILQSDTGPNDATPFRKYPMVQHVDPRIEEAPEAHLMIDNLTFLERAQTGPYWVANEDHSENLRSFWGAVFERYVNDLLSRACAATASRFFPDPRQHDRPDVQICDGIIATENAVVLMEYKASMFRADSKYRGDQHRLLREIEKKWVRNEKGSKKGVEQLAAAVRLLFDGKNPQSIFPEIDWAKIEHVHLCLVTLDTLGETIGMSALLNTYLAEGLDSTSYPQGFICPLHCVDIASLERVTAYFDAVSLPELLSRRLQLTTDLSASLSMVNLATPRLNPWIESEWEAIGRQIVPIVFPGTDMDQFFAGLRENYERVVRELGAN